MIVIFLQTDSLLIFFVARPKGPTPAAATFKQPVTDRMLCSWQVLQGSYPALIPGAVQATPCTGTLLKEKREDELFEESSTHEAYRAVAKELGLVKEYG